MVAASLWVSVGAKGKIEQMRAMVSWRLRSGPQHAPDYARHSTARRVYGPLPVSLLHLVQITDSARGSIKRRIPTAPIPDRGKQDLFDRRAAELRAEQLISLVDTFD